MKTEGNLKLKPFNAWGGRFDHSLLDGFLEQWAWLRDGNVWAIWEFIDSLQMTHGELLAEGQPVRTHSLVRAEIFGEKGHLSLRREDWDVLWHFIGPADSILPDLVAYNSEPFSPSPITQDYNAVEKTALLWGEKVSGENYWFDDRLAWATLEYPGVDKDRVHLHYREYSQTGNVAFVWYLGLE